MNKYLRNFLLNSRVPMLAEWGARDLKRKHIRRHAVYQKEVFAKLYERQASIEILNGPFKGMQYINESVWGSITPKWIGSYEHELWPAIREIFSKPYRNIIQVGCAEGYYAVGFARSLPKATVFAYDLDAQSREQVARLWALNGKPGTLSLERWCDHHALAQNAGVDSLVFCDIEGGEMMLLDPVKCPALRQSDILVEVHQTRKASMDHNADELAARFLTTHRIQRILDTEAIPSLASVETLSQGDLIKACAEGRPYPQVWLWMQAGT